MMERKNDLKKELELLLADIKRLNSKMDVALYGGARR
jgi:hypothetical protein